MRLMYDCLRHALTVFYGTHSIDRPDPILVMTDDNKYIARIPACAQQREKNLELHHQIKVMYLWALIQPIKNKILINFKKDD